MTARPLLRFEKWQGLGNDFVIVSDPSVEMSPALVTRICDRHLGVGADGVLVVGVEAGRPRMVVHNADGSRPEMCGNGLRCVAAWLAAQKGEGEHIIATDAGDKACRVSALGAKSEGRFEVDVDMGVARSKGDLVALHEGREHRFLVVDVGNPHAITFEASYEQADVDRVGPYVSTLPKGGINVEFCRVLDDRITVTVWERGVGRTLACGTGACAVAAAACETGRARFGAPIRVELPGGLLEITVREEGRGLRMRGPAERVFSGELVLT